MAVQIDKATLQASFLTHPEARVSQAYVTFLSWLPSEALQVSGSFVQLLNDSPAITEQTSQLFVTTLLGGANVSAQVSQSYVTVLCRGRVEDPQVRAWTYTLDGHDFYVLRLGNVETLVYDFHAEQWYVYGSDDTNIWRAYTGINWQGGNQISRNYGSNVLVGDDGNGAVYFLNPEEAYDDDAIQGVLAPREFIREIYGQVATRSFDSIPCYGVQLIGSIGQATEAALTQVTLYTSDDQGNTYDDQGTITIALGEYDTRVEWWSLGQFSAPGRMFKISDIGALHRIDYLEMIELPDDD